MQHLQLLIPEMWIKQLSFKSEEQRSWGAMLSTKECVIYILEEEIRGTIVLLSVKKIYKHRF